MFVDDTPHSDLESCESSAQRLASTRASLSGFLPLWYGIPYRQCGNVEGGFESIQASISVRQASYTVLFTKLELMAQPSTRYKSFLTLIDLFLITHADLVASKRSNYLSK